MTVSISEVNEVLLPRRYQEEIFTRAQERNVIAALDTGSGKTYISTLLIKWIATRSAGLGKVIVFLVPKVALVEQQGDFIAEQTSLRVSKCYGATAIDLADRRGWKKELSNHDVLVMTAQIFLNILTHSHWSMDKVSLMVFDECHHTRKNHAYNGIMREYFQWPQDQRPKVFGMTASPIWNPRDAVDSLATLERNLDAKVIAVREHVDELKDHSPKPQEIVHTYPNPPDEYPLYSTTNLPPPPVTLWDRLGLTELPEDHEIPVSKIKTRYDVTLNSLGLYGAELFLYLDIKHRIMQFHNQIDSEADYSFSTTTPNTFSNSSSKLVQEFHEMEIIISEYTAFFEDASNSDVVPISIDLQWCSPKVRLLADLLFTHYAKEFQGIVFVEQRHVAACLSKMLPRIPQLQHYINSAQLIGHGASSTTKSQVRGMALGTQQDVVKMFRDGQINLLVATSVAEEGLDFPACELVIRFDPIQHMVGYIQSRGRARQKTATFIVMVQQGQSTHVDRYRAFSESEPHLRLVYQTRDDRQLTQAEEEEEGFEDPADLAERERYVVPSTGAVLTYNTAIGLLNHLCSLIPRDRFTPVHVPQYAGEFESTLQLPPSLPLPPENLIFTGPPRRSKKEAKRAVAFVAVKRLHELNVFDDYLLPAKAHSGDHEDADGRAIEDVSHVPETMEVTVRDPWTRGPKQWLHIVCVDGYPRAGLVTGTNLPEVELVVNGSHAITSRSQLVKFDYQDGWRQRRVMEDFMRMGLWWCITGRGITLPLTCYLVPINHRQEIDWEAMDRAILHPYGVWDWSGITEEHYGHLMVMCSREHGRPLILRRIRTDLSPMSKPPVGSRESAFPTYHDFFVNKYTRNDVVPDIPTNGPCIDVQPVLRHSSSVYAFDGGYNEPQLSTASTNTVIFLQGMCRWAEISEDVYNTFHILPELCQRITDVYRAHTARLELGLPPIVDDLLVSALTLPSASAGFNNQRLETLGDSVLKLSTVVHLYNRFPHRHEGQLDVLRRNSVSNKTLLSRAKDLGLENYLTSEPRTMKLWRFTLPEDYDTALDTPCRSINRRFPRRSLQDCMEAILGAAFATGGINMALRAGTSLGLSFGGPLPWALRYAGKSPPTPISTLFAELQETLGYSFRCGLLLVEAVTHPSFKSSDSSSYQRLEFLGDALIDLVVMRYLYNKFPQATSGQLSWARSRAVCSPALASAAVKRLGLHRMLLINNVELSIAISKYVPLLEQTSNEDIIHNGWKQDPPKAISDVLESVLGAMFVDCDYNFEKASVIVEAVLHDLLVVLSPNMPRDPVSALMVWSARCGCRKISFRKSQSRPEIRRNDSVSVIVHDFAVVGPVSAANLSLAKGLAAERAREILDIEGPYPLKGLCDCDGEAPIEDISLTEVSPDAPLEIKPLDDETEDGFAALARIVATEVDGTLAEDHTYNFMDEEESEDDLIDGVEELKVQSPSGEDLTSQSNGTSDPDDSIDMDVDTPPSSPSMLSKTVDRGLLECDWAPPIRAY